MADFTTAMSGSAVLDVSQVLAFEQQFIIAAGEEQNLDQFASFKRDIGAKSIDMTKYSRLAVSTTPLTEKEDPASVAMADAQILLTPAEYGNVITTTKLISLQSGGKIDAAAARLVGLNLGQTKNALAIAALDASGNALAVNAGGAASNTASDTMSIAFANKLYNKLSRGSVQKLDGGTYVLIVHDDVAHDMRQLSGWTDVQKYASAEAVLKNEIGMLAGFRVIINNASTIDTDGGASAVDNYTSYALGFNGLGLVESATPKITMTGPFDKLGRFINVGWYGCFKYGLVDTDSVFKGITASSVGVNA